MGVSPTLVFSEKLSVFRLAGAISSLKVTVTCVLVAATASCAGTCCVTVGGTLSLAEPVTKDQAKSLDKAMPPVSCACVVTVAKQRVFKGRLVVGVKVATRLLTS